jgi:hypothetical protein
MQVLSLSEYMIARVNITVLQNNVKRKKKTLFRILETAELHFIINSM